MEKHLWEGEVSKELKPGELPDSDHRWNATGIPAPASDGDGDFDAHMHIDFPAVCRFFYWLVCRVMEAASLYLMDCFCMYRILSASEIPSLRKGFLFCYFGCADEKGERNA